MIKRWNKCKVYSKAKPNDVLVYAKVEFNSNLANNSQYTDGYLTENQQMLVTTETPFDYNSGKYNIEIPKFGDFKITGCYKSPISDGSWKERFRYTLILGG